MGRCSDFLAPGAYCLLLFSLFHTLVHGALLVAGDIGHNEPEPFHFVTRPDITAHKWKIDVYDEEALAPGYWFIAPYQELDQKRRGKKWVGANIYDGKGTLVWNGAFFDSFNVFDFKPRMINGGNVLTGVYPREKIAFIMDSSYRIRQTINWLGTDDAIDMHEFSVSNDGTKALVITRETHLFTRERSQEVGYDGECLIHTSGMLELDITTTPPTTLFNWSMVDHMYLDEIAYPFERNVEKECERGWDASHCNSIDQFSNGDFLVSCRHLNALYKISRSTGAVIWRLGGTRSDFELPKEAKFSRQHHARILEHNNTHTLVTLFDNARSEGLKAATHDYSRGLILSLHNGVAKIVAEYPRPDHGYSTSRGSMDILPNGNIFMGWTFHSWITEHAPNGKILMEATLPDKMNTYRSHKKPWIGRPAEPPDVFSQTKQSRSTNSTTTQVFVSWNGATEVVRWNFYESNPQGETMRLAKSVAKDGFETSTKLDGWVPYVVAVGMDSNGIALGRSKVVQSTPPDRKPESFIAEQDWLEKYTPIKDSSAIKEPQSALYGNDSKWLGGAMSFGKGWMLLAYLGGLFTCFVVLGLWWTGRRVKGRVKDGAHDQRYTRVEDEDQEDDYELENGVRREGHG